MKESSAVLHLRTKNPAKVSSLADKVHAGISTNTETFVYPDPGMDEFKTELKKLDGFIVAKDGSKLINQAIIDQTDVVYGLLKGLCFYVNKLAKGDKGIILLSGFDCNDQPMERPIPGKVVIRRVEDGKVPCSVKIYIERLPDADRYKVEISTDRNNPTLWRTVCDYGSLNNLEVRDLLRLQEIYIRITGGNIHGWGMPSEPIAFIPR
jgi:hypothetical protein